MLASSWNDIVIGVDVHFEMVPVPPGAPIPMPIPNPFIGMVDDPIGLAIGRGLAAAMALATGGTPTGPVTINLCIATNVGTNAKGSGHILIPPGIQWAPMPKFPMLRPKGGPPAPPGLPVAPENDAMSIQGSLTVNVMGSSAVRFGEMWMSCGEPLRLPSSVVIAIPKGMPVLIGGPPAISLLDAILGAIRTKWVQGFLEALLSHLPFPRLANLLSKAFCFFTGHPVDVATGRLMTDNVDFELPGPLPLKFERSYWSSWSHRDGPLGYGWSHSLDQAVWSERGKVVYLAEDGREIEFDVFHLPEHMLSVGQEVYEPINQLTLRFKGRDLIEIETHHGEVREFAPPKGRATGLRAQWWRIQKRRTRDRNEIVFSYDDRDNLQWVRDSCGRIVGFEHNSEDRLVRVLLPHPTQDGFVDYFRYFYDRQGDLVQVTDALGASWSFGYKLHLMVRETNRNGLSFYFAWDGWSSSAACVRTWGDGGIYDHVIDYAKGAQTVVTDSLGYSTTYKLNPIGQVVEVVDAGGASTKYEYDERILRKTKEVTPLGAEVLFEYDDRGNVVTTVDEAGEKAELTYNAQNLPVAVKKPTGTWELTHDSTGRPVLSQDPCGDTTRYYFTDGLLMGIEKPTGETTRLTYDGSKNLTSVETSTGSRREYGHDRLGRVVRSQSESGIVTRYDWDAMSRILRMTQQSGHVVEFDYDAEGRRFSSSVNGQVTRYAYSGFRLAESRSSEGRTRLVYDTEERLTAYENANGELWSFELDPRGLPRKETGFDGRTQSYERGAACEILTLTTASGATADYAYDQAGRLLSIERSDGSRQAFEYGPGGAFSAAQSDGFRVEWKRDPLGRVLEEVQGDEVVKSTFEQGRATGRTSSSGLNEAYVWDAADRLTRLVLDSNDPHAAFAFSYGLDGVLESARAPNGVAASWRSNELSKPIASAFSQPGRLREQRIEWGSPDRMQRILDTERGPTSLQYDGDGRLRVVATVDSLQGWRLDGVGNRFPDTAEWRYEPGGRLNWADNTELSYDEDGNLTQKLRPDGSSWQYRWSGSGRLREVVAPNGEICRFAYDAMSRRVKKQRIVIDGAGAEQVLHETAYVWSGQHLIHELHSDDRVVTWHWGPTGQTPIARTEGAVHHTFIHNHLGVPIEGYDARGKLVWQMELDANGAGTVTGDRDLCPWRWPGQYLDRETGLHYNWFRYYDPEHARYISQDPIGLFGGQAPYAYVADPWSQTDFEGLIAYHHPIPQELVSQMGKRNMIEPSKLPDNFATTNRPGNVPLVDTAGSHAHSQSHAALTDFLKEEHPGLKMTRGTQNAKDWARYLENAKSDTDTVFRDLDKFYRDWLPKKIKAGKYGLLKDDLEAIQKSYDHERISVEGCKK